MNRFGVVAIAHGLALPAGGAAHAQEYPTKPIKMIVGFAAGGPTDVIARIMAPDMSAILGQSVIV